MPIELARKGDRIAITGLRRHQSLALSIALVLLLGLVGLWSSHQAGTQAENTHRSDRLVLQRTLAGLTGQYTQVAGAELLDITRTQSRAGAAAWVGTPGAPADAARLKTVSVGSRALSAGAILVAPPGMPVNAYTPAGRVLPSPTDPGWEPLRASVAAHRQTLPVSGVLQAGPDPVIAVAVPVTLSSGATGLLVGLSSLRTNALQSYVEKLVNPDGRRGYVVDGRGVVIAGPTAKEVGQPLRLSHVLQAIALGKVGIRDVRDGGTSYTVSYANAGNTGWSALTIQDADRFAGPLRQASRRAEGAVVLLLLLAGTLLLLFYRKRESVLHDVAVSDELTGLYNRRGWFAVANHEIETARRSGEPRGLLFIDVDGLKQVNDALGHREGDRAIASAADVLRSCARASDVLGRLGGDEFVLLLGPGEAADLVRQRVLDVLEGHNKGSGAPFELRLSIGAEVWYPEEACSLDELVRRADGQMYADKVARPRRHEGLVRPPQPSDV